MGSHSAAEPEGILDTRGWAGHPRGPSTLFVAVAAVTIGAAVVLLLILKPVRRLMGGVH